MLTVEATLDKMGIALGLQLGEGGFAHVYELHDAKTGELDKTRVVKITNDESDAYTAELARKAQERGECKNLVRVYKVVKAISVEGWYDFTYIIVSERLQLIPWEVQNELPSWSAYIYEGANDIMDAVFRARRYGYNPVPWGKKQNMWAIAASNCVGMVNDLASIGVHAWDDYKPANTMYRPGYGIVASDLGCTQSPRQDIPALV